jgi:hypothetical protein
MSTQSILQQIQQLKELLRFTNTFKDELKARMSSYLGVPVEFKNSFEANNHQPTKKQINTIVEAMEQRDIPFLKQQIQSLETALEIAKRNRI